MNQIITLTLAPAVDVEYHSAGSQPGLNRTYSHTVTAGGKGINVSRAILRLSDENETPLPLKTVFPCAGETGTLLRNLLENEGMEVTTALNGQEAVELFAASEENRFDLILMDVMMPVMDGLTATHTIRAMDRADARRIPIFAMTANAFADDIAESRRAGMNEHLSKPLNAAVMLHTIRRYIAR